MNCVFVAYVCTGIGFIFGAAIATLIPLRNPKCSRCKQALGAEVEG